MHFRQHDLDCLSHASYVIGDERTGRAVVVDPRRDVADGERTAHPARCDRVFPAHGAGSACGKNLFTERSSTIGDQRRSNAALQAPDRDPFVSLVTEGQPPAPAYFLHDAVLDQGERRHGPGAGRGDVISRRWPGSSRSCPTATTVR